MKPIIHAQNSVKKFGGQPEDYIEIHNWFDSSKQFIASWAHRAMYHHTAGIFLCEKIFGTTIKNSDGKLVSVRDIGEQHVLEDFGGKFIPTPQDYLQEINLQPWMNRETGALPNSAKQSRPFVEPTYDKKIKKPKNNKNPNPHYPNVPWPILPYDDKPYFPNNPTVVD
jgi:hypothetical protein